MRKSTLIAAFLTLLSACAEPSKVEKPRSQMTQRERDSTIGASSLPGADVVKKGMSIADAESKRQAMFDSAGREN